MKTVEITKNAKLQKDDDGQYWLMIETSKKLRAMFNLTNDLSEDVLDAFMEDQESPVVGSQN